jgi:hypothetical protein
LTDTRAIEWSGDVMGVSVNVGEEDVDFVVLKDEDR